MFFDADISLQSSGSVVIFENSVFKTVDFVDGFSGRVIYLGDFGSLGDAHALQVDQLDELQSSAVADEFVLFSHFL